jgi:formate dehydrogenase major subunit
MQQPQERQSRLRKLVHAAASWPLFQQLNQSGMGEAPISEATRQWRARITDPGVQTTASVCPYCAVGCSQLIYHKDGRILDIEGNPDSPINAGTLCPKGAATRQLLDNPNRITKVLYRPPYGDHWEERPLEWAMDRIAALVKEARDSSFEETAGDGVPAMRTRILASLGGATLDNEENYLIKKLFAAGLGMVWVENQARV